MLGMTLLDRLKDIISELSKTAFFLKRRRSDDTKLKRRFSHFLEPMWTTF